MLLRFSVPRRAGVGRSARGWHTGHAPSSGEAKRLGGVAGGAWQGPRLAAFRKPLRLADLDARITLKGGDGARPEGLRRRNM